MALQAAQALADQGADLQTVLLPALVAALVASPSAGASDAEMGCVRP